MQEFNTSTGLTDNAVRLKKYAVLASIFFVVLLGLWWVYSHSYIEISAVSKNNTTVDYQIINQKSDKTDYFDGESGEKVRKLVKKGDYEVIISQGDSNSISFTTTKPFLGTTNLQTELKSEKHREFIGNNPSPCMYYDLSTLYSFECDSTLSQLRAHLPADEQSPSVADNTPGDSHIPLEGLVRYQNKNLALVGEEGEEDIVSTGSLSMYELKQDLSISSPQPLNGPDAKKSQNIIPYNNGMFLTYDDSHKELFIFSNLNEPGKKIEIPEPTDKELALQQLSTDKHRIAIAYSHEEHERDDHEDEKLKTGKTTVQIFDGANTKSFNFDYSASIVRLCGGGYICLIQHRELIVYDVSGDKPKEKLKLTNVYNISNHKNDGILTVLRYDGLFEFNVDKKQGHSLYKLVDYEPCGIQSVENGGNVLCLINSASEKVALYVDPSIDNSGDNIDKKLSIFYDKPYISSVSIYKNYIFITPELGETIYDSRSGNFINDPEIVNKTHKDIQRLINESGIDTTRYKVVIR